jgi:hypothetical protein
MPLLSISPTSITRATWHAAEVVRTINALAPEFVCFTGDLVEDARFAPKRLVSSSKSRHRFTVHQEITITGVTFLFRSLPAYLPHRRGWLVDRSVVLPKHDLELVGMAVQGIHALAPKSKSPGVVGALSPKGESTTGTPVRSDPRRTLAWRTVRLPFPRRLIVPHGVGPYDFGYYDTPEARSM